MSATELSTLGGRCRVFRHLRALTMKEVAIRADLDPGTIWRIESDKVRPGIDTIKAISKALAIDTDVLLGLKPYDPEGDTWEAPTPASTTT